MNCPKCGFDNPDGRDDCSECGSPLTVDAGGTAEPRDEPLDVGEDTSSTRTFVSDRPSGPTGWSVVSEAGGVATISLEPGSLLARRYEIICLLGEGGMGAVYKAQDLELDRPVALKLIRPDLAARPDTLTRFKQELILAREVTHPNVVRIYDLGMDSGVRFITMEFVEGQDLKDSLDEGRVFTPDEITDIMTQICRALVAAHAAGVVHRDLKPANIFLTTNGEAKVMDFGVARSMERSGLTQTGEMIGTPDFMSPEQAKGEKVDARSDLFSLGIILYVMLVGNLPYDAETAFGTLIKRTQEPAVPPIKRNRKVPRHLNDIVVRCLQIEPDLRYQSAREILDDLEAGRVQWMPSTLTRLLHRFRRSRPFTRWAAVALALVLLGATWLWQTRRASLRAPAAAPQVEALSLAILPFRNATGNPEVDWLKSSLAEMLRSDIGQSAHLRTVPLDRMHQILSDLKISESSGLDEATLARVAEHGNARLVLQGQYTKLGEQIRIDATLHDVRLQTAKAIKAEAATEAGLLEAIDHLAQAVRDNMDLSSEALRAIEAASFTPSSTSIEALRAYNDGLSFARQGNYVEALAAFKASVAADQGFALAHARLGQVYVDLGRDDEGELASRTAVELSGDLPDFERYLIAANHAKILGDNEDAIESYLRLAEAAPEDPLINFNLADLYEKTGEFDLARERLNKVLEDDPNYVDALYALGRVEIKSGRAQRALDPFNRALTLTVQAENEDGRGRVLNAIGIAYKRLGNLDEALRFYRQSLEIRRRLDQKQGIAASLGEIATVLVSLGNLDEARASLEEALGLSREIGDRGGIGENLIGLGNLHDDLAEYDVALRYYKEALRIYREIGDEMTEAICLNNIGVVYSNMGQSGDALTNFEQALRLRETIGVPYDIGETLHNLADINVTLGNYDAAYDYYLEALEQMRLAKDDLGVAAALHGVGDLLGDQGKLLGAMQSHKEALEALEASGEEGYWRFIVELGYGSSLAAVGRFEEADAALEAAANLADDLKNETLVAQERNAQGENLYYQGELEQAAARFGEAVKLATAANDPLVIVSSKVNRAKVEIARGHDAGGVENLEGLIREADRLGLKAVSAQASLLLAQALFDAGDADGARRRLRSTLADLERAQMRLLLAACRQLLGRIAEAAGDADGAARHRTQALRALEEIRQEAAGEDPFRRADLRSILAEVSEADADG